MMAPALPQADGPAAPSFRTIRFRDPHLALGQAVMRLMGKPGFARLPFGAWSRILVGQINREHYVFLGDSAGRIVGFAGWTRATRAVAEDWAAGLGDNDPAGGLTGECVIINAWQADDGAAQAALYAEMRKYGRATQVQAIYGKRFYPDGRVRRVRLAVLQDRALTPGPAGMTPAEDIFHISDKG
jgi:hemolysin-activating ACP:hemolysin acyltransferase